MLKPYKIQAHKYADALDETREFRLQDARQALKFGNELRRKGYQVYFSHSMSGKYWKSINDDDLQKRASKEPQKDFWD